MAIGLKAPTLLIHSNGTDGATTYTAETGQTVTFAGQAQLDTAQKKFGTASLWLKPISNASHKDEDCADITDWTDTDSGGGASSQATFDSKSCMKLDSGADASGNNDFACRWVDIGTFGTRTVISANVYCDAIGTSANTDCFEFVFQNATTSCQIRLASDGLFVYDGAAYNEVGTNIVTQDTWQEWTFDINWTAKTVDVYLNGLLQSAGVDCSYDTTTTSGIVVLYQFGYTTTNRITYVDWIKVGDNFASYCTVPDDANGDFGTGDFTIDAQIRLNALPGTLANTNDYMVVAAHEDATSPGGCWVIQVHCDAGPHYHLRFYGKDAGDAVTWYGLEEAWSPSVDTWYHIAVVRASGTLKIYVDGTALSAGMAYNYDLTQTAASPLDIGAWSEGGIQHFVGWIDELRIVKGSAEWVDNFTPPTDEWELGSPSPSISPSKSPSVSPSASYSPSESPSQSPSASYSPSESPSVSPSVSPSKSPSISPSISPSASYSPSLSPSVSPSKSPSQSPSVSVSPSPSPGYQGYSRGSYAALPGNDNDLTTAYSEADVTEVGLDNETYVEQAAIQQYYAIHEFKDYAGAGNFSVTWNGQSSYAPSLSKVVLQIWDRDGSTWEDLVENNAAGADTDFTLTKTISSDLDHYKDGNTVVSCRVYQKYAV